MRKALIVFATREGQTEKVAQRIREHLEQAGLAVDLVNAQDLTADNAPDLNEYDLLLLGASMHAGGLEKELVRFVNAHVAQISARRRSFFLLSLSAATQDRQLRETSLADARHKLEEKLQVTFDDTEMIAGALTYSKYPKPLRWVMQRIARTAGEDTETSKDYEYTDWEQVEGYARRLAKVTLEHVPDESDK